MKGKIGSIRFDTVIVRLLLYSTGNSHAVAICKPEKYTNFFFYNKSVSFSGGR